MKLYEHRPIKDNVGGMKSPHMFLTWYTARNLQPTTIIESGVWKGQGTWLLRQACPLATMYCLDPYPKARLYTDPHAIYYTEDFKRLSWDHVNKETTLLFFDDHQNAMERVRQARTMGFRHMLFEDNYPIGQGDCYSLKQALEDRDAKQNETLVDATTLRSVLDTYEELPPVFAMEMTRWNTPWSSIPTPKQLLTRVHAPYHQRFLDEAACYTWMCYARLKPLAAEIRA